MSWSPIKWLKQKMENLNEKKNLLIEKRGGGGGVVGVGRWKSYNKFKIKFKTRTRREVCCDGAS